MSLKSVNQLEKNAVELEILIPKNEFDEAVTRAFKKNAGKISIPGFRRGKAPRNFVEKYYGKGVFDDEAINDILPAMYEAALAESKVEAVSAPEFEAVSNDENGVLIKAKLYRKPDVEVKDYLGLTAEKEVEKVTAAMVDAEIDRMRERNARTIDVTDRAAAKDDTVTIDYEGSVDGVPFEGGKADGADLKLGSGQFIPGFEDQIIGKSIGDEFDVNVTFPTEYHAAELAGKAAVFKVKLHAIKCSELPAADDEFAKDVSEFDTLAEYKSDIKAKMTERNAQAADKAVEAQLIDGIIANMTVDIPAAMIETECNALIREYEGNLRMQGLDLNTFFKYTGMDLAKMREQFAPDAERRVKVRLALEKIVELEKIEVSEEDIEAEFDKIAKAYDMKIESVKASIPAEGIKSDLAVEKAINLIKEKAVITEKKAAKKTTKKTAEKAEKAEGEEAPAEKTEKKKTTRKKAADKAEEKPAE